MSLLPKNGYARAAVAIMLLLVFAIPAQRVIAQSSVVSNHTCSAAALRPSLRSVTASITQSTAQLAAASTLAAYDTGYNVSYNSFFNLFTWDKSCSVTVESVNVVYELQSSAGNYTLRITLNPSLTSVTGVSKTPEQPQAGTYVCYSGTSTGCDISNSCTCNSANWVGPEYYNSNGISQVSADWTIPKIVGNGSQACKCQFIEWTGFTPKTGATDGELAQGGTGSTCWFQDCNQSSDNAYFLWYDFPSGGIINCTSEKAGETAVAYGDSISVLDYPGSGNLNDYVDTVDNTKSVGCDGVTSDNYMGTPYYADFMGELCSGCGQLPDFSALSFSSGAYKDGNQNSYTIGNSWETGYIYNVASVSNITCDGTGSLNWNVCPSGVTSGSFSLTWETSSGS